MRYLLLLLVIFACAGPQRIQEHVEPLAAPDNQMIVINNGRSNFRDIEEVLTENDVVFFGDTLTTIATKSELTSGSAGIVVVNTVSDISGSYSDGTLIQTRGFSTVGDGGGALYQVQAAEPAGYASDGVAVIDLGTNYAVLQPDKNGYVNADWFGAKDLTDDTDEIQAMLEFAGALGYNQSLTAGKTYWVRRRTDNHNACILLSSKHSNTIFNGNNATIQSIDASTVNAIIRYEISTAYDSLPIYNITLQNLNIRGNIDNNAGVGSNAIHFYVPDVQRHMTFIDNLKLNNVTIRKTSSGIIGEVRSSNMDNIQIDSIISHGIGLYKRSFQTQGIYGDVDSLSLVAGPFRSNLSNVIIRQSVAEDFALSGGFGVDFSGNSLGTPIYRDDFYWNVNGLQIENFDRGIKLQGWVAVNISNLFIKNIRLTSTAIWINEDFISFILNGARVENVPGSLIEVSDDGDFYSISDLVAKNVGTSNSVTSAIIAISQVKDVYLNNVHVTQDSLNTTIVNKNLLNINPPANTAYNFTNLHFKNFGRNASRLTGTTSSGKVTYTDCSWTDCFGIDGNGAFYVQGLDSAQLIMQNCDIIMDSTRLLAGGDDVFTIITPAIKNVMLNNLYVRSPGNHITDLTTGSTRLSVINSRLLNPFTSGGGIPDGEIMKIGDRYLWYSDSTNDWRTSTSWPTAHAQGSVLSTFTDTNIYGSDGTIPASNTRNVTLGNNASNITLTGPNGFITLGDRTLRVSDIIRIGDGTTDANPSLYFDGTAKDWRFYLSSADLYIVPQTSDGSVYFRDLANAQIMRVNTAAGEVIVGATDNGAYPFQVNGNSYLGGITTVDGNFFALGAAQVSEDLQLNTVTAPGAATDAIFLWGGDVTAGSTQLFARGETGNPVQLTNLVARVTSDFSVTSSTALVNVTGLSRNVEAGKVYEIKATLYTTSANTGGIKAAIAGTATATSIIYEGRTVNSAGVGQIKTRATALATEVGAITGVTAATLSISGTIVVNAAGTLTIQFAQNSSDVTSSVVLAGSTMQLIPISN